ncbi:MAG: aspartate dehydrogenase domain-containing protein [Candidatus Omnitrophota bacterium]
MLQKKTRVGIIGCGSIGSFLASKIVRELKDSVVLSALYDVDREKSRALCAKLKLPGICVSSQKELLHKSAFIVEAASAAVAARVTARALAAGKDCLIMSSGGLLNDYPRLFRLARIKGRRIFIPSGAIGGIDAVKALAFVKISRIILTTFKPPHAFIGSPYILRRKINLNAIKADRVLFSGNVTSAVKNFPQNINVAATLGLASRATNRLKIRIVASPGCRNNIHEIEVISKAGNLRVRLENLPSPANPKTSFLAMLSALTTLKGALEEVKVGT